MNYYVPASSEEELDESSASAVLCASSHDFGPIIIETYYWQATETFNMQQVLRKRSTWLLEYLLG